MMVLVDRKTDWFQDGASRMKLVPISRNFPGMEKG